MKDRSAVAIIWIFFTSLVVAFLIAMAPGCVTVPPVPTTATCSDVCLHGHNLGCHWSTPTPAGAQCVDVCANAQHGPMPWALDCSVRAETCAAVDACNR